MDAQFTPGPWSLSHELPEGFSVAHEIAPNCGKLALVAIATFSDGCRNQPSRDIAKSNALLIASAPALLAALEAILPLASEEYESQLDCIKRDFEWEQSASVAETAIKQAIAAIDKARGQS